MLILVDSGSTHSFVNAAFVQRAGCQVQAMPPIPVRVANGDKLQSDGIVPELSWWIHGTTFTTDMRVLPLGAYDAILGMDWLARYSPMNCHWGNKTLQFEYQGRSVFLQGVCPQLQTT